MSPIALESGELMVPHRMVGGLILGFTLFALAINTMTRRGVPTSASALLEQGLGQTRTHSLIGGVFRDDVFGVDIVRHVLFANVFQLLISFFYLISNNILTCQLAAAEFVAFLRHKDSLRVSAPKNLLHHSSHFLSLPWDYAVPQLVMFTLLHWLVSQSVFLVQTTGFGAGPNAPRLPGADASRIGWSPSGIVGTTMCGVVLVVGLVLNSFRRFSGVPRDVPRMATESSALAACCQRLPDDDDAFLYPVTLGIVSEGGRGMDRLTFTSSLSSRVPEVGCRYLLPTWRRAPPPSPRKRPERDFAGSPNNPVGQRGEEKASG